MIGHPIKTKKIPATKHAVARAFLACIKYPMVRDGPSDKQTPEINKRFPSRINVLLKKRLIPSIVTATPAASKGTPTLRLPRETISGSGTPILLRLLVSLGDGSPRSS
jgi:hypothetical protein